MFLTQCNIHTRIGLVIFRKYDKLLKKNIFRGFSKSFWEC